MNIITALTVSLLFWIDTCILVVWRLFYRFHFDEIKLGAKAPQFEKKSSPLTTRNVLQGQDCPLGKKNKETAQAQTSIQFSWPKEQKSGNATIIDFPKFLYKKFIRKTTKFI